MTSATETSWHSPRADRAARVRRLDTIAALLIGAVGLGLALAAIVEFAMLYEVGTCPSGHYCTFVQGITVLQLITGVLALVLAAGIAAHRRKARLIGLVVCGVAGGKLLVELLRSLEAPADVLTLGIYGVALALAAAAVHLFVSVFGERDRTHPPPRGPS